MATIRAAGSALTVGELREALEGCRDEDFVYAHGQPVLLAEGFGQGGVTLDDDADMEAIDQALADLLEFVKRLAGDKTLGLREARGLAADLAEEYGH